jgi:hypothetical protein
MEEKKTGSDKQPEILNISPLISVGQHENVSYAQDLCGRVRQHL